MSELNSISVYEHNDRIARLVVWLLDRNAPMRSLGFNLSDNTMRLIRELRAEIHKDTEWARDELGVTTPCQCARCVRQVKARKRKAKAPRVA